MIRIARLGWVRIFIFKRFSPSAAACGAVGQAKQDGRP